MKREKNLFVFYILFKIILKTSKILYESIKKVMRNTRENSLSVNDKKKLLAMLITHKNSFIFWKEFVK